MEVVGQIRRHITYQVQNLTDLPGGLTDHRFDVVFLRNVLIYFEPVDQARVVHQLTRHLARGGFLLVGHSESMVVREDCLTQVAPAIYQKA